MELTKCFQRNENEKKKYYNERVHRDREWLIYPTCFTKRGRLWSCRVCTVFFAKLSELTAEKKKNLRRWSGHISSIFVVILIPWCIEPSIVPTYVQIFQQQYRQGSVVVDRWWHWLSCCTQLRRYQRRFLVQSTLSWGKSKELSFDITDGISGDSRDEPMTNYFIDGVLELRIKESYTRDTQACAGIHLRNKRRLLVASEQVFPTRRQSLPPISRASSSSGTFLWKINFNHI